MRAAIGVKRTFGYTVASSSMGGAVPSLDKLPALIDTLIAAVRGGELDEQLATGAKAMQGRKMRKAA